jgi:NDP-sugar pyrophosphorylase family protein
MEPQLQARKSSSLHGAGKRTYQDGSADTRATEQGDHEAAVLPPRELWMSGAPTDVHAFVQAGGKGLRLRPATLDRPKPMLAVGGMPMVERLLRQLVAAGIRRITVITGYRGEVVRAHLTGLEDLAAQATIDFFAESEPLGNAGSLGRIPAERPLALLAFGDLVTDLDFAELIHRRASGDMDVLLASHLEEHRLQLGELLVEGERVVGYQEKPLKHFLICSGVGVMRREVLAVIPTDGTPTGISDLITAALRSGYGVAHWQHGAFWMDVNSPEALELANMRVQALTAAHRPATFHST